MVRDARILPVRDSSPSQTSATAGPTSPRTKIDRVVTIWSCLAGASRRSHPSTEATPSTRTSAVARTSESGGASAVCVPAQAIPTTPTSPTIQAAAMNVPRPARRAPPPPTLPEKPADDGARSPGVRLGDVDEDVLGLGVEVERRHPELPTDARHLVAAERRLRVHGAVRVHADHAGLESTRGAHRLADVAAPDRAGQAVGRRVGEAKRLFLRVEWDDRDHRPEDLLARDAHVVVDAVEHRR